MPEEQITNGKEKMMSTDEDSKKTIFIMKHYCGKHGDKHTTSFTIADAFACLGVNTHSFIIAFKSVVVYEEDERRCKCLEENVRAYPGQQEHPTVTVKCQDCCATDGILATYNDVVFLDPPWVNLQTNKVDGKVFKDALGLCQKITENQTTKYIFLKLTLESKFPHEFEELRQHMSRDWSDIQAHTLSRHKKRGPQPSRECLGSQRLSVERDREDNRPSFVGIHRGPDGPVAKSEMPTTCSNAAHHGENESILEKLR